MEAMLKDLREYWSVSEQRRDSLEPTDCNVVLEYGLAYLEPALKESREPNGVGGPVGGLKVGISTGAIGIQRSSPSSGP